MTDAQRYAAAFGLASLATPPQCTSAIAAARHRIAASVCDATKADTFWDDVFRENLRAVKEFLYGEGTNKPRGLTK